MIKKGYREEKKQKERQVSTGRKENYDRVLNFWVLPLDITGKLQTGFMV